RKSRLHACKARCVTRATWLTRLRLACEFPHCKVASTGAITRLPSPDQRRNPAPATGLQTDNYRTCAGYLAARLQSSECLSSGILGLSDVDARHRAVGTLPAHGPGGALEVDAAAGNRRRVHDALTGSIIDNHGIPGQSGSLQHLVDAPCLRQTLVSRTGVEVFEVFTPGSQVVNVRLNPGVEC